MNIQVYRVIFARLIAVLSITAMLGACGGETVPGETCNDSACTEPPAAVCQGDNLVAYAATGTCDETGECMYEQEVTNCIAQDAQCVDGACVPNTEEDLCEGVVCDAPPASSCDGNSVVSYEASGECVGGVCQYDSTETACEDGEICQDGACVPEPDPCENIVCDDAPESICDGNTVVSFAGDGECQDGTCVYEEVRTDCLDSETCVDGACYGSNDVNLVITELHYNPSVSQGDDADFEFIEIFNAGMPVNLEGYSFSSGVTHTFESYEFASGTYLVVAVNAASYAALTATTR